MILFESYWGVDLMIVSFTGAGLYDNASKDGNEIRIQGQEILWFSFNLFMSESRWKLARKWSSLNLWRRQRLRKALKRSEILWIISLTSISLLVFKDRRVVYIYIMDYYEGRKEIWNNEEKANKKKRSMIIHDWQDVVRSTYNFVSDLDWSVALSGVNLLDLEHYNLPHRHCPRIIFHKTPLCILW